MEIMLYPLVALPVYFLLVFLLSRFGRLLSGPGEPSEAKSSTYTGGEQAALNGGAPGYRPFFVIALFFAVLHLGALMLGLSEFSWIAVLYILGLIFALVALILG